MSQPIPTHVRLATLHIAGEFVTAVVRTWRPGDVPHCRLCDQCSKSQSECMHLIRGKPTPHQAALMNLRGVVPQNHHQAVLRPVSPLDPPPPSQSSGDWFREVMALDPVTRRVEPGGQSS